MVLPIIAFGSQVLRKKCYEIDSSYKELSTLIENMWETMHNASGVGLAAPQIGLSIRLFIVDTHPFFEDETDQCNPIKEVFINPFIIEETGEILDFNEGCLSIPNLREDVSRKSIIKIQYFDSNFNKQEKIFDGISARVIQHEYDHIEGILFVDRISVLRKRMIKRKLLDISKGNISTEYRMKFSK